MVPARPTRIAEYALAASEYVRRAVGVELDGSVESLAFVDHYIGTIGSISDEVLGLVAPALGAYFGEVVIARLGGRWEAEGEDPAEWMVALSTPGGAPLLSFRPVGMAAEAIRCGEAEPYDASVKPPPELAAALSRALAKVAPVEESYYYSLTGRLEMIEHMVDLLVALRRGVAMEAGDEGDEGPEGEDGLKN